MNPRFVDTLLGLSLALLVANPSFAQDPAPEAAPAAEAQEAAPAAEAPPAAPPTTKHVGPAGPPATVKPSKPAPKPAAKAATPVAKGIQLNRRATLASGVNVHDKVLEKCEIETTLPQLIAERNSEVTIVEKAGGTHLELRIVDIHAPSGGVFSGPKWITVEGKLLSGKTVKGTFTAKETSMGSAGTCGMLHKVMVTMSGDIAAWLINPSKDAKLGRAR